MRSFFFKCLLGLFLGFSANLAQAQNLKLEELLTSLNAPQYPNNIYALVEQQGFERIDKQWLIDCDRAIYYFTKEGNPSMFVNPTKCFKMVRSPHLPAYFRNEIELQFQKSGRPEFEALSAQVKKQCRLLGTQRGAESGANVAGTTTTYRHDATGTTLVIDNATPVAYIYLIR